MVKIEYGQGQMRACFVFAHNLLHYMLHYTNILYEAPHSLYIAMKSSLVL